MQVFFFFFRTKSERQEDRYRKGGRYAVNVAVHLREQSLASNSLISQENTAESPSSYSRTAITRYLEPGSNSGRPRSSLRVPRRNPGRTAAFSFDALSNAPARAAAVCAMYSSANQFPRHSSRAVKDATSLFSESSTDSMASISTIGGLCGIRSSTFKDNTGIAAPKCE